MDKENLLISSNSKTFTPSHPDTLGDTSIRRTSLGTRGASFWETSEDGRQHVGGSTDTHHGEGAAVVEEDSFLSLVRDHTYYDPLMWLADQHVVGVRLKHAAPYAAVLDPEAVSRGEKHLPSGRKLSVPLALAEILCRSNLADLLLPTTFSEASLVNLRENPCVVDLKAQNPFYFEVGMKVASLTNNPTLATTLLHAAKQRMCLKKCDEEERQHFAGSGSAPIDVEVFLRGLTHTEQKVYDDFKSQLLPNDGRPSLPE